MPILTFPAEAAELMEVAATVMIARAMIDFLNILSLLIGVLLPVFLSACDKEKLAVCPK
jgi:hypothetical protein